MGSIIAADNHKDNEESGAAAAAASGGEEPEEPVTPPTAGGCSNFPGGGATEGCFHRGGENLRSAQERDIRLSIQNRVLTSQEEVQLQLCNLKNQLQSRGRCNRTTRPNLSASRYHWQSIRYHWQSIRYYWQSIRYYWQSIRYYWQSIR
jgi:hypothetical protein